MMGWEGFDCLVMVSSFEQIMLTRVLQLKSKEMVNFSCFPLYLGLTLSRPAGKVQDIPGCCRMTMGRIQEEMEEGMAGSLYLRYITEAARRVLAICCREGCPSLAHKVSHSSLKVAWGREF